MFLLPSPLVKLTDTLFQEAGVNIFVKRDDLIHPQISGNKWRKLKYNFITAESLNKKTILTFGGAYSNHIFATAAAGKLFNIKTIGVVRGEEYFPLNPTLKFAKENDMELIYLNRMEYKNKHENISNLLSNSLLSEYYIIPEGGANEAGVKGCKEIVEEINTNFDYICCPCGTGTTLAGIALGLQNGQKALGFSALKGGSFLENEVNKLINDFSKSENSYINNADFEIQIDYHFGGYAKSTPSLIEFMNDFEKKHLFQIEQIYTAKMFFGLYDLIKKGYFEKGTTIIAVHTGGLQGRLNTSL